MDANNMRYVRLGEILLDADRKLILLCENCNNEFTQVNQLRTHFENCKGLEFLFQRQSVLAYDERNHIKKVGQTSNGVLKQYNVYNYHNVTTWEKKTCDYIKPVPQLHQKQNTLCSATNKAIESQSYKKLVKEITPYMQINIKSNAKVTESSPPIPSVNGAKTKNNAQIATKPPTLLNNLKPTIKAALPATAKQSENKRVANSNTNSLVIAKQLKDSSYEVAPKRTINHQTNLAPVKVKHQQVYRLTRDASELIQPPAKKSKLLDSKPIITPTKSLNTNSQSAPRRIYTSTPKKKTPPQAELRSLLINSNISPMQDKPVVNNIQIINSTVSNSATTNLQSTLQRAKILAEQNAANARQQQTEKILNRLQTLGLEIKRKPEKPNQTMELLKKLQSKGMNIKVVSKVKSSQEAEDRQI